MVPGTPRELHDHDGFGLWIGAENFARLAKHTECATQKWRFATHVVFDLRDEIVAIRQLHLQPQLVVDGSGLGGQSAIRMKRCHIAAPSDEGNLDRSGIGNGRDP